MDSSRGLLIAVLIVSAANLLLTGIQTGLILRQPAAHNSAALPKAFTEAELAKIARRVTEPYNRGDIDALYDVLDDVAKNQIPRQRLAEQIAQINGLVGKVDSAAYVGFQKLPNQGGLEIYQLNYVVKLSGGRFQSGGMIVNVIDRPQAPGIVGFFINGKSQ